MSEINSLGKTLKISSAGGVSEDLSGALIELSATVTAGKKLLAQSLVNKGVENITSNDSLSRMAEAVDALDADGLGGVNPDFPIMFYNSSFNTPNGGPNFIKTGDFLINSSGFISFMKEPDGIAQGQTKYNYTAYDFSTVQTAVTTEDTGVSLSSAYYDIKPIFNSSGFASKFFYIGGNAVMTVNINEDLTLGAVTAKLLKSEDGTNVSLNNNTVVIWGADEASGTAVVYSGKTGLIKVNMSTGIYQTLTVPGFTPGEYLQQKNARQLSQTETVYSYQNKILVINWNWAGLEESQVFADAFPANSYTGFGQYENKIYFAQGNGQKIELSIFNRTNKTFAKKSIDFLTLNKLSSEIYFSSALGQCIAVAPSETNADYTVVHWGSGYLVLDGNHDPVPYIKNSGLNCALSCYGWTSSQAYTDNRSMGAYYKNGAFAVIWDSYGLYFARLDVKYNKVLAVAAVKNGIETIYKNSTVITTENIADGGPFDAASIILPVDLKD